jgi:PAS domain S-box-containing protein
VATEANESAVDPGGLALISNLLEGSPSGVFVLDADLRVVWVNSAMLEMLGVERATVLGRDKREMVTEFIPSIVENGEEVAERMLATYERAPEHAGFECHLLAGEKRTERWLAHHSRPLSAGPLAGGRIEFCTDITDRKRAEDAVERLAASVEEQGFILENMVGFTYRHDTKGVFHYMSPSVQHLTGHTPDEWMKHYTAYLTDNPLNKLVEQYTEETLRTGVTNSRYKVEVFHKNGERVMLEVTERAYFDEGQVAGIVGVAIDITARERAEHERFELERRLQHAQKLESMGILAGGIAHDFNNLLMAVLGNAGLALDEVQPGSKAHEHVEEIVRASRRAADLCRQMLSFSGKGTFTIQSVDLSAIVAEMASMLEVSISKKVRLVYDFADDLPPVEGDPTQIQQVALNLITNASEAIGDAPGTIHVRTGSAELDRDTLKRGLSAPEPVPGVYVWLEVEDTGEGMDEATRTRIFDPFFTTKFTGRGLGLSTVLGIMRGHEGAIRIVSMPGEGTRFRAMFPAGRGVLERKEVRPARTADSSGGTVLLVDDEAPVRKVGRKMLEKLGHDVITANDGREGLELYRARRAEIACVVLDMTMPEMGGDECLRELRKIDPGVSVVVTSGYDEADTMSRLERGESVGFLQKPYDKEALGESLRECLG